MTPDFSLVIFGGTGDLTMRKLLPAMYQAFCDDHFGASSHLVCVSRAELSLEDFRQWMRDSVVPNISERFDEAIWQSFIERVVYQQLDVTKVEDFEGLKGLLEQLNNFKKIYYLATAPSIFDDINIGLAHYQLNKGANIVIEKPLGVNLASCKTINDGFAEYWEENQIFRIDHYLGKESVQNLMALRFGNSFFEPIWRREYIDHVQITIAEKLGVEKRADFYDKTGALRDMVQSHVLQLLCIAAMDPPASMEADAIRDEKLAVLRSLKLIQKEDVAEEVIFGQYVQSNVNGEMVNSYIDEAGVPAHSKTETYVALKAEINNWRFAGVPFYLRTGKRMAKRMAEIVVVFKSVPYEFMGKMPLGSNRLVIELQPEESIKMYCLAKKPGAKTKLAQVHLDMDASDFFSERRMEGYERLLLDAINDNLTLFVRRDEQEQAWEWIDQIVSAASEIDLPVKQYNAGTWGPSAASALVARDGSSWHEEF